MAGNDQRSSLQPQTQWQDSYAEHPVNELLSDKAGSQSPFGDDVIFPLPVEELFYDHPGPESRPNR